MWRLGTIAFIFAGSLTVLYLLANWTAQVSLNINNYTSVNKTVQSQNSWSYILYLGSNVWWWFRSARFSQVPVQSWRASNVRVNSVIYSKEQYYASVTSIQPSLSLQTNICNSRLSFSKPFGRCNFWVASRILFDLNINR